MEQARPAAVVMAVLGRNVRSALLDPKCDTDVNIL